MFACLPEPSHLPLLQYYYAIPTMFGGFHCPVRVPFRIYGKIWLLSPLNIFCFIVISRLGGIYLTSPRAQSPRGRVTVIRYIPTRRDVTGLYPVGYYGLHHTAAQLLWSLNGNRFCVILAHWYLLDRLSFSASG